MHTQRLVVSSLPAPPRRGARGALALPVLNAHICFYFKYLKQKCQILGGGRMVSVTLFFVLSYFSLFFMFSK